MRKGKFAFVIYILGALVFGGAGLFWYLTAKNNPDGGMENLGFVLLMVISLAVAAAYVALFIVKGIYMLTGLKLFSVLCLLADLGIACYLGYAVFLPIFTSSDFSVDTIIWAAVLVLPPVLAFFSEARSLGD